MTKEKLTHSVQQTKICENTKDAIRKISDMKDRKEQEIVRYALNALAKRFAQGKIKDEDLF